MTPHIALLHVDSVPTEYFRDFVETVRSEKLDFRVLERPSVPMAGIEWLMPTAIFVYLAKPYFESFLKEMGKDHYALVNGGSRSSTGASQDPILLK